MRPSHLRWYLLQLGWTHADFARIVGVTPSTVERWTTTSGTPPTWLIYPCTTWLLYHHLCKRNAAEDIGPGRMSEAALAAYQLATDNAAFELGQHLALCTSELTRKD